MKREMRSRTGHDAAPLHTFHQNARAGAVEFRDPRPRISLCNSWQANTWEAGDHTHDTHGRMGAGRVPHRSGSSISRGMSSGNFDRRVSIDLSLTSEGSAESLGSPRGGGGFDAKKMRNARKAMMGASFKGLSGFSSSTKGFSTSFSQSKRLQRPPIDDDEEDESMLSVEEKQKRKAVLSFLSGVPQHPMRVVSASEIFV